MKKAVIFDLDGTLVDSLESIRRSADHAIGTCGFAPIPENKYKLFVGDGAELLIRRCLAYSGDENETYFEKAMLQYRLYFRDHCTDGVKPYEGIPETLRKLKEAGVKIAVFSNKPHENTLRVVETVFGKGFFDQVLGQSGDRRRKPHPDGVYELVEKMGISVDELAYVGDTNTDMMTGKAAGAYTIGVLWGFRDRQELEKYQADVIIERPEQIAELVLSEI